jgi:hypothetical protein
MTYKIVFRQDHLKCYKSQINCFSVSFFQLVIMHFSCLFLPTSTPVSWSISLPCASKDNIFSILSLYLALIVHNLYQYRLRRKATRHCVKLMTYVMHSQELKIPLIIIPVIINKLYHYIIRTDQWRPLKATNEGTMLVMHVYCIAQAWW